MAHRHTKEKIMSYDKLTLASFTSALKEGKYQSATGARRAVGKATTLSEADKNKARAAIDAKFGADATVAKKTSAAKPKTAAKKTTAKKTASAQSKKTAAAAPKTSAAPKKKTASAKKASAGRRQPVTAADVGTTKHIASLASAATGVDFEDLGSIATQIRLAEKTVQNVGAALGVITQAKKEYPEADLQSVVEEMGTTLSGAVGIFRAVVNAASKVGSPIGQTPQLAPIQQPPAPAIQSPAPIVNNGQVPSRGETLFRESQDEGTAESPTA